MTGSSPWPETWKIVVDFLRASLGFGLAWLLWQMAVSGFELFKLFAIVCAVAGAKRAIVGLVGLVRLILDQRRKARFRAQGATPKADKLASDADLKRRGLIR